MGGAAAAACAKVAGGRSAAAAVVMQTDRLGLLRLQQVAREPSRREVFLTWPRGGLAPEGPTHLYQYSIAVPKRAETGARDAATPEHRQPAPPSWLFPQVGEGGAGLAQPVMMTPEDAMPAEPC